MNTINIRKETVVHADDYVEPTDDPYEPAQEDVIRAKRRRHIRLALLIGLGMLAAGAAGAGVVLHRQGNTVNMQVATNQSNSQAQDASLAASCLGYVDGAHGVTPLVPSQPGRVVEVLVGEGKPPAARRAYLTAETVSAIPTGQVGVSVAALARITCAACVAESSAFGAPIQENMPVKAGTVLFRMDDRAAREKVEMAQLDLNAEIKVHAHKEKLHKSNYLSETELYASAQKVKHKEAQLRLARLALEECAVKAPADGAVLRVLTSVGELFGPQSRQPAMLFCADGPRIIRAEVEQEFANRIAVGQTARIEDHAGAPGAWTGRVTRISDYYAQNRSFLPEAMLMNEKRTLEFIVELEPDPKQPPLRIGQRVRVKLER